MLNSTTKANILGKYGITMLCHDTVGDCLINLGLKYNSAVKNYYVYEHEKKEINWYWWNFIDNYLLL